MPEKLLCAMGQVALVPQAFAASGDGAASSETQEHIPRSSSSLASLLSSRGAISSTAGALGCSPVNRVVLPV